MPASKTSKKTDDLKQIIKRHKLRVSDTLTEAKEALEDTEDRIREVVNTYQESEDRAAARLSEMENILIESEILEEPKQFPMPEPETDLEFLDGLLDGIEPEDEYEGEELSAEDDE